ncbi:MAG: transcription elongation factor GreA [Bacillota bacterium]
MEKEVYLTAKGLEALKIELDDLKINQRAKNAEDIKTAREFGDLSENAEYDAAKEEQGKINARISEIEMQLRNVVIIDENVKSDIIQIGSTVTIYDKEFDEKETYTIVGVSEADPSNNKLSNESPIGAALLGKKKGDVASAKTPGGVIEIEIISVD